MRLLDAGSICLAACISFGSAISASDRAVIYIHDVDFRDSDDTGWVRCKDAAKPVAIQREQNTLREWIVAVGCGALPPGWAADFHDGCSGELVVNENHDGDKWQVEAKCRADR